MIDVRAWLASASWACLCGIAGSFFLTVAVVGLFVLFFGALISAMLSPLLMMLPADWQWTGWQFLALGVGLWLATMALFGVIARWAWIRCRAVVFSGAARWPRPTSVIAGIVTALVLLGVAPNFGARFLPQDLPMPEPSRDDPVTV